MVIWPGSPRWMPPWTCVRPGPAPAGDTGGQRVLQERGRDWFDICDTRSILRPFFGRDVARISRSSCRECTKTVRNNPLLERLSQTTNARFPTFAPNSHISAQKSSNIRAIYQMRQQRKQINQIRNEFEDSTQLPYVFLQRLSIGYT